MNYYIPEAIINEIEELKELGNFDEAIKIVNSFLIKDPNNEDALLQVADIQYRSGEISKATKAIDFLNSKKDDYPLGLYIKGVLEMEKNNWSEAKKYLKKALELTDAENYEIIRCYGLCEYWYGNREKGLRFIKDAFIVNNKDAEIIYNLIEIHLLENDLKQAKNMINYFKKNYNKLETLDKDISYYEKKIGLFEKYLKIKDELNL